MAPTSQITFVLLYLLASNILLIAKMVSTKVNTEKEIYKNTQLVHSPKHHGQSSVSFFEGIYMPYPLPAKIEFHDVSLRYQKLRLPTRSDAQIILIKQLR